MAAGGRRLKMVDKGAQSLFGDDDEEEVKDKLKKRRDRELGEEGDLDEIEFEDDFADDDEKMNVDGEDDDEEAKELEERIKRETRAANKLRQAGVDEDESEEEDFLKDLTGAGKDVKKALRTFEKNAAYDSDDDKNPYLTSEDEEEEEVPPTPQATGPDASSTAPPAKSGSKPSQKDKGTSKPHTNGKSRPSSRATSPTAPGTGSSLLAHRATSPKGKGANGSASRASSPKMSGGSGRPMSPTHPGAPRAASPLANGSGSRATSPAAPGASKKRKAEDLSSPAPGGSGQPAVKKVKKTAPSGAAPPPGRQIDEALVVEWLRVQSKPPTTMECISKFRAYLVDKNAKIILTNIIKKVAELKGGVLTLKPGF
ncbi:hypothetical protein EXIGLDRAFT_670275 [Exidia glandulosa HHB12029]|uniref:Transcription initiation factor IIF subunit alpha n=1 Tax=Exidia glandulosa HHB12029 TaxID=1314781 RepID=A0A165L243_EXIGL|nr:hypothetical protein EXIGLDRAFT_670275 [Exidia glandulosa HHB12029]